ncbi:MAG: hypothetical protein ACR2G6_07270 [Gemmatimonadaceae bacterium]
MALSGARLPRLVALAYIERMRRSPVSCFAGLLMAMLAGLSAPSLALAHGYAHHEAHEHAEHEREHHGSEHLGPGAASHDELTASLRAADHPGDHAHPQLFRAVSVRTDVVLFVAAAPAVSLPADIVLVDAASLLLTAAPARAGPADAPPRQPRAPPLG